MINRFFSDTLIYSLPNFFSRAVGLFLVLFYTRFLTPNEYGLIELILVLFSLLNVVLPLEITQAVARHFGDANKKDKSEIISTSFIFTFLIFSFFYLISLIFSAEFSKLFFSSSINRDSIHYIFIFFIFYSLLKLFENQLRWSLKPIPFAYLSISASILMSVFPVYFIFFKNLGIEGFIKGILIGAFLSSLIGFIIVRYTHSFSISLNLSILKKLLSFSAPLVFSSAAYYVFNYSDRWMLSFYLSTDSVGLYGAASRIASLAVIFHVLFRYSFMPLVYSSYKDLTTKLNIGNIFVFVLHLGILFTSFIFLFSSEITSIMLGEAYQESSGFLGLLSLSLLFVNLYFYFPGLSIAKKTKQIAGISITAAIINLLGNYYLIPVFKEYGAAYSSLFASALMVFLYYWLGQREYKISLNIKTLLFFPFCALSLCFLGLNGGYDVYIKISIFSFLIIIGFVIHKNFLFSIRHLN